MDEYVRTPERLSGSLRIFSREPGGATARASYRVFFADDGAADSAHLSIRQISPAGTAETPERQWSATFSKDGRVVEVENPGGRQSRRLTGGDVLPLFGPSIATMEAILMRARRRSVTRIPVFHLAAAGRVDTVAVRWIGADSAYLSVAGATVRYRVDEQGRILGGRSEAEELRTVRIR